MSLSSQSAGFTWPLGSVAKSSPLFPILNSVNENVVDWPKEVSSEEGTVGLGPG